MALRSLLRKGPAFAGALRSPTAHAPSTLPGLKSPSIQALAPAAGARAMSQTPGALARQTVYTGEMLREEGDRVHAEFLQKMRILDQQRDDLWRLEVEQWARLHQKLDNVKRGCNVIIVLPVTSLALQAIRLM
ncbi:unnamed protein product [Alopecurus aequalis]